MNKIWRLGVVLVLLLSACELQANFVFNFEEDGSGDFVFEMGFDEEMEELLSLGSDGEFEFDTLASQFNADIPGAQVDEFERDGLRFFGASVPFGDATDLNEEVFGGDSPFTTFNFSIDDETATIDATVDTGDAFDVADLDAAEIPEGLDFADIFGVHFQVDMPGSVTSHNADRVLSNGVLEWDVPIVESSALTLQATSSLGGGSFPWTAVFIIGLVVLAAIIAVLVIGSRRSSPTEALAEAGGGSAPGSWLDTTPPANTLDDAVAEAVEDAVTPMAGEPVEQQDETQEMDEPEGDEPTFPQG